MPAALRGVFPEEPLYLDLRWAHDVEHLDLRHSRFRDAVAAVGHVWVPYAVEQIRGAPKVDPKRPISREYELALLEHYGVGGDAGRAAEVASRDEGSATASPLS